MPDTSIPKVSAAGGCPRRVPKTASPGQLLHGSFDRPTRVFGEIVAHRPSPVPPASDIRR
jgi:hypothetical protein